jgi:hypothetical protein
MLSYTQEVDIRYETLVKRAGLYGKAFFGHKASRKERKMLNKLYSRAQREITDKRNFLNNL